MGERHTSVIGDAERVSVIHAGQIIRNFVARFFGGCRSCRELWMKLYDEVRARDSGKEDWVSLAMWIWEVHNEITIRRQRAVGTGYHRPQSRMASLSSLWPRKYDCSSCWTSLTDDTSFYMNMDSYDREEVYRHLKKTYWPGGEQNNRLIVLDRWSKATRALSTQPLQDHMAAHNWHILVLIGHVLVGCIIFRIVFPRSSIRVLMDGRTRRVMLGRVLSRKGKRAPKSADRSHPPTHVSGWSSSSRSCARQSMPISKGCKPESSQYWLSSNEGRRRREGRYPAGSSGPQRFEERHFNHFLDL